MTRCYICRKRKPRASFYADGNHSTGIQRRCKSCDNERRNVHHSANPIKRNARSAVNSAIQRGIIERQPCRVCGSTTVEAHHDDYTKPLAVRWLCREHHRAIHKPLAKLA